MCGIIGMFGNISSREKFESARDLLSHRGPDDSGVFYDSKNKVALGHRRLSIIDLSSFGRQPMVSNDMRYYLVFNGEIYNYIELKKELNGFYEFKTNTDSEVIIASYVRWGNDCVKKFNGMFAFAIWDSVEKKLFCARDRVGIKPFFYHKSDRSFIFSSEIKGILALISSKPKANESALFDYLYYGMYDHRDETFFKDIFSLSPGYYLEIDAKGIRLKKYWDVGNTLADETIKESEAEEKFKELLFDSIKLMMRSDVPVGINLSSGLDSNGLFYFSKLITGVDPNLFSMCSESKRYDECEIINEYLTVEQKKRWRTCTFNQSSLFEQVQQMNDIQDQPYGGIPTIAYGQLCNLSKEKDVTVLLEGQGLDEILCGYKYYEIEYENDVKKEKDKKDGLSSFEYSQDMTELIDKSLLNTDFFEKYKYNKINFKKPFDSYLLNAQYRDIRYAKLPRVLRFNDHASMNYGREIRVPYLDHRIIEFCFSLPTRFKILDSERKVLARNMMRKLMPDIIRKKEKVTFGAVQTELFRSSFKKEILELINSKSFRERPFWNHDNLSKKIKNFYKGDGENSFYIWQCVNLEFWFRKFID